MNYDFEKMEQKLSKVSEELKKSEKQFKETVQNISKKDETKQSYDILYEVLSQEEKEYHQANEAYKKYISQYSKEYIEMSEWYYGPELPYDIYLREFKKTKMIQEGDTYLDSPEDVKELYKLFIFFMMFQSFLPKTIVF
mgnify:FL=1